MEIPTYHTIADFFEKVGQTIPQDTTFSIIRLHDLFKATPYQSAKFKTDYFSFVFIKRGSGNYTVDSHQFNVKDNCIYFTNPGHIKSFYVDSCENAYMINFTESFLSQYLSKSIYEDYDFLLAETLAAKTMSKELFDQISFYYKQIENEIAYPEKEKFKVVASLLGIIFQKLKTHLWPNYNALEEGKRSSQIVTEFKQILDDCFKLNNEFKCKNPSPKVELFSTEIGLHPNYLSSVIKSKTGRTISDWVNERKILLAKLLLTEGLLTTKLVAYELEFNEPTHFSRFFKKHCKQTPSDYVRSVKMNIL